MPARMCTVAEIADMPSGTLVSTSGVVLDISDTDWHGYLIDDGAKVLLDVDPTTYALVSQFLTEGARVRVSGTVAHDWTGPELHVETVHAAEVA